jgi:uncharacterized protein (TIGR00251 family)
MGPLLKYEPMEKWIKTHSSGTLLDLYIQPGASKSELAGEHNDKLKVKIKAPPRDGEANSCLIEFLSECLGVPKRKVHLLQGESSRQKLVLVELTPEEVLSRIKEQL